MSQLAGRALESALGAELTGHLGYPPGQAPPGSRTSPRGARGRWSASTRVAVVDVPVDHGDRVSLVERHIDSQAELTSLCAAYIDHSRQADCPAIGPTPPLQRSHGLIA